MSQSKKRNSTARIQPPTAPPAQVGGRQEDPPTPAEGGGYLATCTKSESAVGRARADMRVGELRAMGLSPVWRRVAEAVGFEAFLTLWATLDAVSHNDQRWQHKGNIRLNMPSFRRYRQYQRNLWIQQLDAEGYNHKQIKALLSQQLGVDLSITQIGRIAKERHQNG